MSGKGAMRIAKYTDDELRGKLIVGLFGRFEAERRKDPSIRVVDRWPLGFSLSRHGDQLTVDQGRQDRLMQITLEWKPQPEDSDDQDVPWTATVFRTADGSRLALTPGGPEGSIDEIVADIAKTFLSNPAPK
jgi:hypothetical protein